MNMLFKKETLKAKQSPMDKVAEARLELQQAQEMLSTAQLRIDAADVQLDEVMAEASDTISSLEAQIIEQRKIFAQAKQSKENNASLRTQIGNIKLLA